MQGAHVLILNGKHKGAEGVYLGKSDRGGFWAISLDDGDEILSLALEKGFRVADRLVCQSGAQLAVCPAKP